MDKEQNLINIIEAVIIITYQNKIMNDFESKKPLNQTLYFIKGLSSDHPANKDFNKYMQKRNKNERKPRKKV